MKENRGLKKTKKKGNSDRENINEKQKKEK